MAISLFKHNQDAYNAAAAMLAETGKAAVIHPTGTGKSFIGFKLCEDHLDQTILWLSPSEYIFRTQLENLADVSNGWKPENIKFLTYARLMNMSGEEIGEIKPYAVVFDEYYRAGAAGWSKGIESLLKLCPDALILGLSATNIRYLDNQRDMADELFDGNIASQMTLGEAIVRGILNPPIYVLSVFSYQDSLEKYSMRVKKAQSKAVRDKAEKYLDALRRALDKADGLDVIFDKHMTNRTGKYIVFCADSEAMQEAMDKVSEWFYRVDENPHIYSVYFADSFAEKSFNAFKADNDNTHLRLLFCIDALNEGVHVEDVSGVILLRPTISPIIYKQQIGRALSAGKSTHPVIFDVVNNIENLYSIDAVREEMQTAIRYFREYEHEYDIVNDTFEVVDEVHECMELFHQLEETLTASWDIMFIEAQRYYEEHGDLLVPQAYINENGYRLGQWVGVQRVNYQKKQYLSESRIRRLESIGMCWLSIEDRLWNKNYEQCRAYYEKHGSLSEIANDSKNLSVWIVRQRKQYRQGLLDDGKIKLLEKIGMIWDLNDIFEHYFQAANRFYEKYGHLDIPAKFVTDDENLSLGSWYRGIRKSYQNGSLSDEKIRRLEEIGIQWDSVLTRNWMIKYRLARQYYEEYGNLNVRSNYKTSDGTKLGVWISSQREKYGKGLLNVQQIEMLGKIQMSWNRDDSRWENGFSYARQYTENTGDINTIPANYVINGFRLTAWLNAQRDRYRKQKLSVDRIEKLESIGLKWNLKTLVWESNYQHAREYYLEHGDLAVMQSYVCADGFKLGVWLSNIRTKYRTDKLTSEQIKQLESIGMIWKRIRCKME